MNKFSLATAGIIVAALVTSVSVNAATDTTKTNVTPKGMSCQELLTSIRRRWRQSLSGC